MGTEGGWCGRLVSRSKSYTMRTLSTISCGLHRIAGEEGEEWEGCSRVSFLYLSRIAVVVGEDMKVGWDGNEMGVRTEGERCGGG